MDASCSIALSRVITRAELFTSAALADDMASKAVRLKGAKN